MVLWILATAQAAPQLWLDVHIEGGGEQVDLAMPYTWLQDGIVSTELTGAIESVHLDLRDAATELGGQPIGSSHEWWLYTDTDTVKLVLSSRPEPSGRNAKRLVVESGEERYQAPLFVTRAAARWVDMSSLGEVTDWVHVDRALGQLGHMAPFTLVQMQVDNAVVRVATE